MSDDTPSAKEQTAVKVPSKLDVAEQVAKIASVAAIPVVLAVGGWLIQRQLQSQTVSRDYVQLSLTILQNPDQSKVPPELREWAVDLLNRSSPVQLNPKAMASLKSGTVTLPSINFVASNALSAALKTQLESALKGFQAYMTHLGFPATLPPVSVDIRPGTTFDNGDWVARGDVSTSSIIVASAFASDTMVVLRQLAHQYLFIAKDQTPEYRAIESGLATYFPCSSLENPVMGDKASLEGQAIYRPEDLRNKRQFSEVHLSDEASVQNDGSEIWGGAFWQLRELLGKDKADRLLADTWRAFQPRQASLGVAPTGSSSGVYSAFVGALAENASHLGNGVTSEQIRAIFKGRGLRD